MRSLKKILSSSYALLPLKERGGVRILMFHEILDHQVEPILNLIHFLKKKYSIISPTDYQRAIYSSRPCFIISFDDGFKSQYKIADEVLDFLGVKALFFVCPAFVRLKEDNALAFIRENMERRDVQVLSTAYEPIDWKALKDLSKRGHVIGCHSMSHARLSTLTNDADFKREIVDAGKKISDRLECEVSWFAYPFGDIKSINRKAINIIGENYRYCCSGLRGINTQSTNSLCISRQSQQLNQPLNFSANVALGAFDFVYMFKYFKLNRMVQ